MDEAKVRFPVTCSICGAESLGSFEVSDIAGALINHRRVRLYATCHNQTWDATIDEVLQIREYLGSVWLNTHRGVK
jgi:hypothetical protein